MVAGKEHDMLQEDNLFTLLKTTQATGQPNSNPYEIAHQFQGAVCGIWRFEKALELALLAFCSKTDEWRNGSRTR